MDDESKERINRNRHTLVTYTNCSAPFLEFFCQKEIFRFSDIDFLKSFNTDTEKALQFYRLIETRPNSYPVLIEGLKLTNQYEIAQVLEEGVVPQALQNGIRVQQRLYDEQPAACGSGLAMPKSNIKFEVYDPVSLFTGRTTELAELHRKIWRSDDDETGRFTSTLISQFTAICGLGGIGKTQLARQYILKYSEDFNGNCIWLNAETEEELSDSFKILSNERLGISTKGADGSEKKIKSIVADVYRYFQASKCLFVFDNADNVPWLKRYLPRSSSGFSRPSVLITSRNCDWDQGIEVVDLEELDIKEAITLIENGLGLEGSINDHDILQLAERLQCFPLAIGQAISYIQNQIKKDDDYAIDVYLDEFEESQQYLLSFERNEHLNDYTLTTMTTWKMTVDKIGQDKTVGKDALEIFNGMAYLNPDNIDGDLFSSFSADHKSAIQLLVQYSMIRREKQKLLSIHRLVQEVTRMELVARKMEKLTLENLLDLVKKKLNAETVEQMLAIWTHVSLKYRALVVEYSKLLGRMIGLLLDERRDYEVINFGNKAVAVLTEIGETEKHILDIEQYIYISLGRLARFQEALDKIKYVVRRRRFLQGQDHIRTLTSMYYLANEYVNISKPDHAYKIYQKVYKKEIVRLPTGNAELIVDCRLGMARALRMLGKCNAALDILKDVNAELKVASKKKNALSYKVKTVMLYCLAGLNDFDAALKIIEEDDLEIDNLNSKFEHWCAIDFLRASGNIFSEMKLYEKALDKHQQAYEYAEKIFGSNYRMTMECKFHVGDDLFYMAKYEEAIKIFEDTLMAFQMYFPGSFYFIRSKVLLGCSLYDARKDLDRALDLLYEAEADINNLGNSAYEFIHLSELIKERIKDR